MKRYWALLALAVVLVPCIMTAPAEGSAYSEYSHLLNLRMKEKWLQPGVQLPNEYAAYVLDFHGKLHSFASGRITRDIEKVDMTFQGVPFAPSDTLRSRDQARALTQFGMLAAVGHFAILNVANPNVREQALAYDPTIRDGAVSILNQLSDLADHFKIDNLSAQYQRLASDVADPRFVGGPSPIIARYDATLKALYDWVTDSYGVDGHWYFMLGDDFGGLYVLTAGGDRFNDSYYLSVLNDLREVRPHLSPDGFTLSALNQAEYEPRWDDRFLSALSWSVISHYVYHSHFFPNPYRHSHRPHEPHAIILWI